MCLRHPVHVHGLFSKTPRKSIKCYKVLRVEDNKLYSIYFPKLNKFQYQEGREYYSAVSLLEDGNYVGRALHSFSKKEYAEVYVDHLSPGIYALAECTIPKYSLVFRNKAKTQYASSALVINKIIKYFDYLNV